MKDTVESPKDRLRKILPYLFMIYLIIQPILDTSYLFSDEVLAKFGVSPSTVIRFAGIAVLLALTFIANGWNKKDWWAVGYAGIVAVYFAAHCLYARNFHSLVPGNFNYSILHEGEYLVRLLLPLLLIVLFCNISFDDKMFKTTALALTFTISGLIVVTNLFCISLDSYTNLKISGNIFAWFGSTYKSSPINGFASKAFFSYANQISVILCMLLPLTISIALEKTTFTRVLALILQCIAMLMLGTRTSTYSCIAILVVMLLVFLIIKISKSWKRSSRHQHIFLKQTTVFALALVVSVAVFPKSPSNHRRQAQAAAQKEYLQKAPSDESDDSSQDFKDKGKNGVLSTVVLQKRLKSSGISDTFFQESYPYQYDKEFWTQATKLPFSLRGDNRYMEELMLKRVMQVDGRPLDSLLGLTYSRTSHIYNLERDFLYQYYSMGLIGLLLLLGPYIAIPLYGIFSCLRHFKRLFTYWNFSILASCVLAVGTSYFCGNSMDALFVTTILSMVCSQAIRNVHLKEEKPDENFNHHANVQ